MKRVVSSRPFALLILTIGLCLAGGTAPIKSHVEADRVLCPRFIAAMNEFQIGHMVNAEGHYDKVDAKDKRRWLAARDAWKALEEAMKEAGY